MEKRELFSAFRSLLLEYNEKVNLTAITEIQAVIEDHFVDSLKGAELDEIIKGNIKAYEIDKIDYNDSKVLALIGTGKCEGIFQLESAGMKSFMKELKPKSLEDVIAGISLYRPGPMDFIPTYIHNKHHPEDVVYDTPFLEPILKNYYGVIVYQEQIMQVFQTLADYSLGQADIVRRMMGKKKVLFFSLEMTDMELTDRLIASESGISADKLKGKIKMTHRLHRSKGDSAADIDLTLGDSTD